MSVSLSDVTVGSTISFSSKAPSDNNLYYGIVVGTVTSVIASKYDDITTYNSRIQSSDNTVPDVTVQEFFLIELLESIDNTNKYLIPFSQSWINLSTLTIVSSQNTADLTVYGVNSTNINDVINLLLSAGFGCKVNSLK